jgi:hypothetical protein
MITNYHTDQRPAYECSSRRDRLTTPSCRSVAAACVDAAVADALLNALTPAQVALALSAADQVAGRHQRASRAAELAVERARYEADRAERAFHQVEPENRLVARSLEARWEAKLAALAEAEQAAAAVQEELPPLPSRAELEKLAADLPRLWEAPTTSARDRKRLLRTLIADVTLLPEPDHGKVRIGIRWHTGATDELVADRPIHPGTAKRSPAAAVELVRRLGPVTSNDELARRLNSAGHRTGHGRPFDITAVQWIRHAYKIPVPDPYRPGRDLRGRGRQAPGLQHRRHLPLDPHRAADRPPRPRQPFLHPLERPGPGRLPGPDRQGRPPGPHCPPAQAPCPAISRRQRPDQRHRSRLPTRLQHLGRLLLDRNREAHRPPRPGQPAAHPLERSDSGRMPRPHPAIRAPQPSRPPHQATETALTPPESVGTACHAPRNEPTHAALTSTSQHQSETIRHAVAGGAV